MKTKSNLLFSSLFSIIFLMSLNTLLLAQKAKNIGDRSSNTEPSSNTENNSISPEKDARNSKSITSLSQNTDEPLMISLEYTVKQAERIYLVGISVETSLENDRHLNDIRSLWERQARENLFGDIPNDADNQIYIAYTDYNFGNNGSSFTVVMGRRVTNLDSIPAGFISLTIPEARYAVIEVSGNLEENVPRTWIEIEEKKLSRTYTTDLEVYDISPGDRAEVWVAID